MSVTFLITAVLLLVVLFAGSRSDAASAVLTAASTRVLSSRTTVLLMVAMNFAGSLLMAIASARVAYTMFSLVSFPGDEPETALAAALFAVMLWCTAARTFEHTTSESYALMAGLGGAALATGGISALHGSYWALVGLGILVSSAGGFCCAFSIVWLSERMGRGMARSRANRLFGAGQLAGSLAGSFLHGAQDGQKFMGIFLLALVYNGLPPHPSGKFLLPPWVIALCSLLIALGTLVGIWALRRNGAGRIRLEKHQSCAVDLGSAVCLLGCTLAGIPVSSTHTSSTALLGAVTARHTSRADWRTLRSLVASWALTIPGCGLIAFLCARLFILIF